MTQLSSLLQNMSAAWSWLCPGMDTGWDKYSSNIVKGEEELALAPPVPADPSKTVPSITITPLPSLPHCSLHVSAVPALVCAGCLSTLDQTGSSDLLGMPQCQLGLAAAAQCLVPNSSRAGLMQAGTPRSRVCCHCTSCVPGEQPGSLCCH